MTTPAPHPITAGRPGRRDRTRRPWRAAARMGAAALLLALVAPAGCSDPVRPVGLRHAPSIQLDTPPAADSPAHLLMRFRWAWEHQDCTVYRDLFTDDYVFTFAAEDSAANPPLTRDLELIVGCHIFAEGTPTEPPANRITLTYASELLARPDRRPGKAYPWHQEVPVRVILKVETDDFVYSVDGKALFFVVRGDSASIPPELLLRGFGPDPNRWYIEGWVDQTGVSAGSGPIAAALPAGCAVRRHGGVG